jgi:hypothetical protein
MDRVKWALIPEAIKALAGFLLIFWQAGSWFGSSAWLTAIVGVYFLISFLLVGYFVQGIARENKTMEAEGVRSSL